jgi:hypothetical protein
MSSRDSVGTPRETSQEQALDVQDHPQQKTEQEVPHSHDLPEIVKSQMYMVEEDRPEVAYQLFVEALAKGTPGLCFTRVYPAILTQKYDFGATNVLWLSNAGKDESIRPRDLERLSLLLEQFLVEEKGVALIDGIEYLITNNDFVTVLRLIQSIRDQVAMNEAVMIVTLNPSTLGYQELNLLEREMDCILRLQASESDIQQDFHLR